MTNSPNSEYMKIAEAARFLGVTQRWVYRRVLSGELPASKVGGLYFISRKDLQSLLDAGRVIPGAEENPEQESVIPRLKCGFCYRLLQSENEVGGVCEHADCGEIICQKCWELNIHTCVRHSPTRDQRLQQASKEIETGALNVLVKEDVARLNETSFLNRIHARLSGFSTLIHPVSGEAVNVASWDEILETGDDRTELMHLLGKVVLDTATTSQLPLNAWHHYLTRVKNKKVNPLEVHVQVVSHMETMVRDGFDTQRFSAKDLGDWIEKLIEVPSKTGNFRLVLLASTTGWDDSARQVITGGSGFAFNHRLALLYLFDMGTKELIFNTADDRARRYSDLFRPILIDEDLSEVIQAVIKLMGIHDSISLKNAQQTLSYPEELVSLAFEKMTKNGDFVLIEISGFGITLTKKQAL